MCSPFYTDEEAKQTPEAQQEQPNQKTSQQEVKNLFENMPPITHAGSETNS